MNILDIIIIAIVVLAIARGLFKGLVRELVSLGAIALGIFLASRFHGLLEPYIGQFLDGGTTTMAASYLIIFLGTVFLSWILAKVFREATDNSTAGTIDTVLGGLFGFCEGVLISLVVVLMLGTFLPSSDFYTNSLLTPRLVPAARIVAGFLPESFMDAVTDSGNTLPETDETTGPTQPDEQ